MPERLKNKQLDFIYLAAAMALLVFGLVMVFSSSSYAALKVYNDSWYFFKRECAYALIGLTAMVACIFVPTRLLYRMAPLFALISMALLMALFTPLGSEYNYATRWIEVGPITIMPGEIAKFAVILMVARYLSSRPERIRSLFFGVLPVLIYCGVNFLLIYKQPSLSTAVTLVGIVLGLMFLAGMNLIYAGIAIGGLATGLFYLIISDADGYHFKRMTGFLDPFALPRDEGWQVIQSLLGLGAGGVFGVGLGNSIQKALYLPEGHNDFILSVIGEELGFVGCLALLLLFMLLIYRGAWIAIKAPDRFGMLTAAGITIMFALQVILNVLVVTSWMPPTGVTLPFISYGGNALILCLAQVGVILNISRGINAEPAAQSKTGKKAESADRIGKRSVVDIDKAAKKRKKRVGAASGPDKGQYRGHNMRGELSGRKSVKRSASVSNKDRRGEMRRKAHRQSSERVKQDNERAGQNGENLSRGTKERNGSVKRRRAAKE